MSQIYCGNNAANPQLVNGQLQLGTRYGCLKKGIGRGLRMPVDPEYSGEYIPIDNRKMYCGNKPNLPTGYDVMGNLPQCLQKGVGVGKRMQDGGGYVPDILSNNINIAIGIFVLIAVVTFSFMFFNPPNFIVEYHGKKKIILWGKFVLLYVGILALWGTLIFSIWYFT